MIIHPDKVQPFVDDKGFISERNWLWAIGVTNLQILSGSGSPDGAIEAQVKTLYMDTAGSSGSILYIKRDADVSGDRTQGWILV